MQILIHPFLSRPNLTAMLAVENGKLVIKTDSSSLNFYDPDDKTTWWQKIADDDDQYCTLKQQKHLESIAEIDQEIQKLEQEKRLLLARRRLQNREKNKVLNNVKKIKKTRDMEIYNVLSFLEKQLEDKK